MMRPWTPIGNLRHQLAVRIAPWLDVPYPEAREDAFRELALVAYGSRDAVWTSPIVLVKVALDRASYRRPDRILMPDHLSDEEAERIRREWKQARR